MTYWSCSKLELRTVLTRSTLLLLLLWLGLAISVPFGDFFFQAEDGIRDKLVTGVQTCALPIWPLFSVFALRPSLDRARGSNGHFGRQHARHIHLELAVLEPPGGEKPLVGRFQIGRASCRERV